MTPASGSSVVTLDQRETHGMTLRVRNPVKPVKRVLEDSESEDGEGGEGGEVRTRSWGACLKRQRLSSDDSEGEEGVAMVTRTSRGRVVKPIKKFS